MVGACKDRLADALTTYGRVPIVKRTVAVDAGHPAFRRTDDAPLWSAAGLVHDPGFCVLLVRHAASSTWADRWVTPGGWLGEGETTTDGFRREVREEVGLELLELRLTRIFNETLADGHGVRHAYFAQFVAEASTTAAARGRGIREVRWFDGLPEAMAYRDDYLEDFARLRAQRL